MEEIGFRSKNGLLTRLHFFSCDVYAFMYMTSLGGDIASDIYFDDIF